jgi:hypothetical protein
MSWLLDHAAEHGYGVPAFNINNMEQGLAILRTLPSRWVMGGNARLAHFYYAFGIVFLRCCYHQVLGPRRRLPEFANGFCRHVNARLHFDPHMTWQAAKSYV